MGTLEKLIERVSKDRILTFLRDKIPSLTTEEEDLRGYVKEGISEKYISIQNIGTAKIGTDDIIVITAELEDIPTERSEKKQQYEIAKRILKKDHSDAALFVFYQGNCFRFSFIQASYLGSKREFSTFRRYTYFVSPDQSNETFKRQVGSCNFESLEEILEAFSVEPLNKAFYKESSAKFHELIDKHLELPSGAKNSRLHQDFGIRLIGRIIFCWFLKNKCSSKGAPLIADEWLSSQAVERTPNYYHKVLEKLFFLVLNQKSDQRPDDLPPGHEQIPFLNGGLFESHKEDFYSEARIGDQWFCDFFEILEQYNFTIDENSAQDTEVSIDPEMLGTIFENLLAEVDPDTQKNARKATGSFYTPRAIVDYMVQESLIQYLRTKTEINDEQRLKSLFEGDGHRLNDIEKKQVLRAFSDIKILDPACGSGAFPIGILHKIVWALEQLDPEAEWWKEDQLKKITNPIVRRDMEETLERSNSRYARKLGVLQHSIYGVDVQPVATEISKLRCFLSLIIEAEVKSGAPNLGITPLPNLEFKFLSADTLIGLEDGANSLDFGGIEHFEHEIKKIHNKYLQAYGEEKEKLKSDFYAERDRIVEDQHKAPGLEEKAKKLATWDPFSNASSPWFDPMFMFGVPNFDIIIGNPPYVQLQKDGGRLRKQYEQAGFETFARTGDIYGLFYERAHKLLSSQGSVCLITSNKWMRAEYGQKLRNYFINADAAAAAH